VPNYDFTCLRCDVTVEKYLRFDDNARLICKKCGDFMQKVFNPIPAHFKGGGWGGSK